MKNQMVAVRLSEQQSRQLAELEMAGYGNQSDVIRIALDRIYQKEIGMNKKYQNWLMSRFSDLNVGGFEELNDMLDNHPDELETMIDELEMAQAAGELNLETDEGVENLRRIVDSHMTFDDDKPIGQ